MTPDPGTKWHDPALLDHLRRVRQPWDAVVRRVVRAVLKRYLPDPLGTFVEIGAGGGHLREWLPGDVAAATTHTEPSEPFVRAFRERHPTAKVVVADAAKLPFDAGSVSGVLALCVLDTLPDLASVRAELARVLRPGGVVVHVLDLSTSPDALFPELIAGGDLPLTNFARDPALLDVLTPTQRAALPPADDFDEVLAVRWGEFVSVVGMLARSNHPLATTADLGPYARLHEPGGFDPDQFALDVMSVSADAGRLLRLNRALLGLFLAARQFGKPWAVRSISTRAHLRAKLCAAFAPDHGFAVEFAGPLRAWEVADEFTLRHAGRTVSRPLPVPGTPVEELEGVPPAPLPTDGVRVTTVEVFVARRL